MMIRSITLAILGFAIPIGAASAQLFPPPPAAVPQPTPSPNFERAYRYFQNSPATFKEISAPRPGVFEQFITPLTRESFYVDPGHYRERVTPYSFEVDELVPGYGGSFETPWSLESFRVPAEGRSYAQPLPPRW